ncbi:MaoC/PaaZ C-terminal domain-containing protein [Tunicatimonas pelagia]|uniref:MaoC/PaaZ C-terminal domain-containing protein n=1 Tax=Tunicatimonas pelagia TaxID=931531 RepID=UPI00266713C6|nr:MaoC/PaaZ C-terminal domain-containing protein [Tunicatimonas pelagia]WKN46378.1 MaoC/PaaZ C-terminal domain-containing protein [Tunicatimonas pelagia]
MFTVGDTYQETFITDALTYEGFIDLFKDKNPLHTDAQFARSKSFKDRVMHGNILNGYISYFIGECLPSKDVVIHSQEIKYHAPVYLNDELSLHATVSEIYDSVNAVVFKYRFLDVEKKVIAKGTFQIGLI